MCRAGSRRSCACGHDAVHLGELGLGRLPDEVVFTHAIADGRIVVTFDLDFGGIVAKAALAGCGVALLRLRSVRLTHILTRLEVALAEAGPILTAGSLVLVEDAPIRVRRAPTEVDC